MTARKRPTPAVFAVLDAIRAHGERPVISVELIAQGTRQSVKAAAATVRQAVDAGVCYCWPWQGVNHYGLTERGRVLAEPRVTRARRRR